MGRLESAFLSVIFATLFAVSWGALLFIFWPDVGLFVGGMCWMYAFRWFYVMARSATFLGKERDD